MNKITAIVLAAGSGSRMKSKTKKHIGKLLLKLITLINIMQKLLFSNNSKIVSKSDGNALKVFLVSIWKVLYGKDMLPFLMI